MAADLDGDGRADLTFFTPSIGRWKVSGLPTFDWGLSGDVAILRNLGR
jgi:hypothetical protein